MIMLGALTRIAAMDLDAMRQAMLSVIPRFHEQNLRALDLGYALEDSVAAP
jgi:Pyruvate/2-oxoacid:ferredoxin oxidoreductase gamma subunit